MMPTEDSKSFLEVFELFVVSQTAKGVADVTLRNYRYHMKNIGNYMNTDKPFDMVTKPMSFRGSVATVGIRIPKHWLFYGFLTNPELLRKTDCHASLRTGSQ